MGLGSTAKKVQQMVDMGEELYGKLNEVRAQLNDLRGTVEETGDRVEMLEAEISEQRALLEALAEEQGLDIEAIRDNEAIDSDESAGTGVQSEENVEATVDN